ncbi:MAG: CcdB family protein [Sphingomonadales bacterium]
MARFDVYRTKSKRTPLVVDVQAEILSDLASRVVIPLSPVIAVGALEISRLSPNLVILDETYVLMTTDLAAVARRQLGPVLQNIETEYGDIVSNALDFLLYGF